MRRTSFAFSALAALAVFAAAPRMAQAQVTLGPTVAWHDDADVGVGATLTAGLSQFGEGFGFMADFLYFFPDGFDYLEINGNVTYDLPLEGSTVMPFVLGGLNVARISVDIGTLGSASNTEVGLNLGGGIRFDAGNFRPTVAGRFELSGGEGFVLWATLPFAVGGN
jgi:hypothetical protein